ncbi:hypothetical protein C8J57DRAFT_1210742 [Mycena rebaudengoi]|nr:hypothetical protein C8J57DRAFT_1210742 [Mycena rebaudengoi]
MSAPQKLTKKQKKGIAFRDRKGGKGRNGDPSGVEDNEVPVLEVQDLADVQPDTPALEVAPKQGGKVASKAKEMQKEAKGAVVPSQTQKKRKRDDAPADGQVAPAKEGDSEGPKRKKAKGTPGENRDGDEVKGVKKTQGQVKQRFILFVGNLKYTTTAEAVKAHFAACDPPPTVRLRTPKPSAPGKPINKSKGCAFVEFSHRNALQQGLKLHQSELEGRMINVELTVGGGGKSDARITKLKERNKDFVRTEEKLAKTDPSLSSIPDRPQRFSATSGLEQAVVPKRTWTVGDVDDDETHRGGKKHRKERPRGKQWGTGVNAIPVG